MLSGEQTGGQIGLVEAMVPPGGGPPPHIHERTDETFYMVNGELEFLSGDETFTASSGDVVFLPRGNVHRFHNPGIRPATLVFIYPVARRQCSWRAATSRSPASRCSPGDPSELTNACSGCSRRTTPFCRLHLDARDRRTWCSARYIASATLKSRRPET
ncbi:cupin domain [Kribbella orskensis]|uniref:Cupin domain n=1 Tax=Kribbella orskensis TaxID=2512216 RepID=A0ABY2BJB5_9ACTN|nr:cupin domain [Kribbella sp. VKM Ac-2500]TCO22699.1 cupin domain [Kribbella orskensis]